MNHPDGDWVSVHEIIDLATAAELLGVSRKQVTAYCAQGRLGRRSPIGWIITRQDVQRFRRPRKGRPPSARRNQEG